MKKLVRIMVPLVAVAVLVLAGYLYWRHETLYPNTDDAYVHANIVYISPRINGKVSKVYVHNHQQVRQGQKLFEIDSKPYQIALNKAIAQLDGTKQRIAASESAVTSAKAILTEQQAELVNAKASAHRMLILVKQKYESPQQGDLATKNLQVAEANVKAAESRLQEAIKRRGKIGNENAQIREAQAAVNHAKLNLQYTTVTAPADGSIDNFSLRQGDVISAYSQQFAIIESKTWWVDANFKETQLNRIKPGQAVTIKIDMYPGEVFHGHVSSISDGSGTSFSLLPAENASGNWVKVTQRFPVKILITDRKNGFPLRLGASSTVTVDTVTAK